jgi:hypothetical protein
VPTNKLWIEHTERAAWQSVEALRSKLAKIEERHALLAPPIEGWQTLLDAMDALRAEQKLPGGTYAESLHRLVDELKALAARTRELETELVRSRGVAQVALTPIRERRRAPIEDDHREPSRGEERLLREVRRRPRSFVAERGRWDPAAVLSDVEGRLGDLPDLDPAELFDAAADLAALALSVRSTGPDD